MTTASFSYNGWDADQVPYSHLIEGDTHATAVLSTPLLSDSETVAALIVGTSDSQLLAVEPDLVSFGAVTSDSPAFWNANLAWETRTFSQTCLIAASASTTSLPLNTAYQPYNGGSALYGTPVVVIFKNGSTDEDDWTWDESRITAIAWSTDHWVLTVDTLTATPAEADICIIGGVLWTYDFWEQFAMGGSNAHELRLWVNSALPNGSTQLYQLQEFVADDNRTMGASASSTTAITSAKHGQRGWISLGRSEGTHVKVRLKGVTASAKMELRWVQIAYGVRQER